MYNDTFDITEFSNLEHRQQVATLWREVFNNKSAHNLPELAIDKKIAIDDGLFFVAVAGSKVIGTIMAGYDGHRGWIYSMAVLPAYQKKGIGSALLKHAEKKLSLLGCVKINLQIIEGNEAVQRFYQAHGFLSERRISLGKRINDSPKNSSIPQKKP